MQTSSNKVVSFSWKKWIIGTIIILFLSLLLYLPKFGQLPAGLNRDEAALGYNAYSLLKTGKDEWGKSWPISITSFGDQKLPGYIYILIPFIAAFGLETWVVRLPSLLSGLIVIVSIGLITIKLAKLSKLPNKLQLISSLLTMIFVTISPWSMHFSRVAYETHLAMAFFTSSLACLLFAIDTNKKIWQRLLLIKAGLLAGLTLLTYHSYQIFIPIFLLAFLVIFYEKVKKIDKTGLIIGAVFGLISIGLIISGGVLQANQTKSQGINALNSQSLLVEASQYRGNSKLPTIFNKILFNKYSEGLIAFSRNYVSTFSGTFFFIHGSGHGDHNPGNGSNLNLFLAPFILLGLIAIGKYHQEKSAQIIAVWLLLALIPSSLTTSPLLEVRIATIFPAMALMATLGIIYLFNLLSKKQQKVVGALLVVLSAVSTIRLFVFYTAIAPFTAVDNSNYHLLAKELAKYEPSKETVLTQSPSSSPYIWYLFENKINPNFVQQAAVHYPMTDEGFIHVKQIGNVHFETINWDKLGKDPYILILKPTEISDEQRVGLNFALLETIRNGKGETIYEVWKYN